MKYRIPLCASAIVGGLTLTLALADTPAPKAKTTHQNYTEVLKAPDGGKVTFDMVAVPGGEFLMGSPENEPDRKADEGPQVKVKVKPFWMAKFEVSWDEFDLYFRLNNFELLSEEEKANAKKQAFNPESADAVSKPTMPYVDETYGHEREKHPAICMTHHAAMKYCEWLSKTTGKTYRLPTEAEWEYAARAGTTDPMGLPKDGKIGDHAWFKENSKDETHPRGTTYPGGQKKPNAWGIHDLQGNVMEWCIDHYVEDAYARYNGNLKDGLSLFPHYKPTENKWWHVARGGHFRSEAKDLRVAARTRSDKQWMRQDPQEPQSIWWLTSFDIIGFRVIRPVEDDELKGITSKVIKQNDAIFKPAK